MNAHGVGQNKLLSFKDDYEKELLTQDKLKKEAKELELKQQQTDTKRIEAEAALRAAQAKREASRSFKAAIGKSKRARINSEAKCPN